MKRPFFALVVFFFFSFGLTLSAFIGPSGASGVEGKEIFLARNCTLCHQTEGPAGEKTIGDVLKKKGPELWYAGSKFRKEFLSTWLKDPALIRPMEYNSLTKKNPGKHPALKGVEAEDVASYLMELRSREVRPANTGPELVQKGKVVFIKKQACYGCHQVREKERLAGGLTGPSLDGAGERLKADWVYSYLSNPKAFKPVRDMPDYTKYLDDSEMMGLAAYISGLK